MGVKQKSAGAIRNKRLRRRRWPGEVTRSLPAPPRSLCPQRPALELERDWSGVRASVAAEPPRGRSPGRPEPASSRLDRAGLGRARRARALSPAEAEQARHKLPGAAPASRTPARPPAQRHAGRRARPPDSARTPHPAGARGRGPHCTSKSRPLFLKFLSRWLSNFSLSAMAGPATLSPPPARAPRDPPQPPRRTDAPRKPAAAGAARPSAPFLSPGLRGLRSPAAPSCPEPGHHSSSGEDNRGAGGGGNGGGMCCRLRGGGGLDLRARLRGHAHRRQPGPPIGRPASGALGQSKGAMESGGRKRKRQGEGRAWDRKGPGRRGWGGEEPRAEGETGGKAERGRPGSGRGGQGAVAPFTGCRGSLGCCDSRLRSFLLRCYLRASFTLEGKEVCPSSTRGPKRLALFWVVLG